MTRPPLARSYWIEPGRLLGGALPSDLDAAARRAKVAALLDAGVRRFINLMEPHEVSYSGGQFAPYEPDAHALAAERGFEVTTLRFPIRDMGAPRPGLMEEILAAIDDAPPEEIVFVHCWGGVGRTGTVACCWLLEQGLAEGEEVFSLLAERRRVDAVGHRRAPESTEQRDFVRRWAQRTRGRG
jgi:hypothetical protein